MISVIVGASVDFQCLRIARRVAKIMFETMVLNTGGTLYRSSESSAIAGDNV